MTETVKECEQRIGRKLTRSELDYKKLLDSVCACGHTGHEHSAPLLGGPEDHPCWVMDCPCYSFPEGLTMEQKRDYPVSADAL